jgi:putative membrane protein
MWPFCHLTGVGGGAGIGGWSAWTIAGAVLGTLVPLVVLAALAGLGIVLLRRLGVSGQNQTLAPLAPSASGREIAQARYARGELTRDEYNELLSHLGTGKAGEP